MIVRLGQNLGMKLLSLVCSFALFLYVHKQQAGELQAQVPLTIRVDPTSRIVNSTLLPRTVSVTLSGPSERLQRLERQTRAVVDLRGRRSGTYTQPVEVTIEPSDAADPPPPLFETPPPGPAPPGPLLPGVPGSVEPAEGAEPGVVVVPPPPLPPRPWNSACARFEPMAGTKCAMAKPPSKKSSASPRKTSRADEKRPSASLAPHSTSDL